MYEPSKRNSGGIDECNAEGGSGEGHSTVVLRQEQGDKLHAYCTTVSLSASKEFTMWIGGE